MDTAITLIRPVVPDFEPFPKIKRFNSGICITEKLDGTNGQIMVTDDNQVYAGSRNRWLSVSDNKASDNYGFCSWVEQNKEELVKLGPGRHYGEWWGCGIGRGYDLHERRFSLFNVLRWNEKNPPPDCCGVVPVLYHGDFNGAELTRVIDDLAIHGSYATPFKKPEGIVIYWFAAREYMKWTYDGQNKSKHELTGAVL